MCGGELSRRRRLKRRSDDVGEHVREQENVWAAGYKAGGEFIATSVITHSYLGGVGVGDRHSVQVGRRG